MKRGGKCKNNTINRGGNLNISLKININKEVGRLKGETISKRSRAMMLWWGGT